MRIALIDDDVTTNFINKRKLTKEIEGCEVIPFFNGKEALDYLNSSEKAENGKEAYELCSQNMPDAILLDWNMPVMNGLEFLKNHSKLPVEKKIDKIFLFAEQGVDEEFFKKHELFQVLKKPLTNEIIELITRD